MQTQDAIDLIRNSLFQVLLMAGPLLLVALVVGVVVGIIQTVLQLQDSALTSVPRLFLVGAALILILPWIVERMVEYSQDVIVRIPHVVSHQDGP